MMDRLISEFPAQLKDALEIGISTVIADHDFVINSIFVAGLGGSGIGANIVSEFIKKECLVPFTIGKSYHIPKHINKNTLAIVSSYSGNTEETISCLNQLLKTGAKIVCISSGGKMIELAKKHNLDYIQLPGGAPSPRACLGYSMVQQLCILHKLDLISDRCIDQIKTASDLINYDVDSIKELAKQVANKIYNKIPILYATDRMEAIIVRARQQINENAKMLCWHNVIPEMNHNEILGWRDKNEDLAVIYFRNSDDYSKNKTRIEINKQLISQYCSTIIELTSKGSSLVERSIYFIHLGDWLSWYLSKLKGVDAIEIDAIDFLKSKLAES